MFRRSFFELRHVRTLTTCALMAALAVILGYVATIRIGPYIRIGFSFLPNVIVNYLFGPAVGGIFGGVLDIIKYLLQPDGPFFPGFTLTAVVAAILYGVILYRKPVTLLRVFSAQLLVKCFANVILNTLWLHILYGQALAVLLPSRMLSNAIMLPIDTAITYAALKFAERRILPAFQKTQTLGNS